MPKIIQPSPETAALFKFQDYPMDYSTGLPQISIPIYEVKSGTLSLPISLSYHASGRKVTDQDGPIAVGWNLNAGGMVSRTTYSSPDFGTQSNGIHKFPYPFVTDNLDNYNNQVYLQKLIHFNGNTNIPEAQNNYTQNVLPWLDGEYDVFSYSIGNNSGKFIFKDINNVKTLVLLPFKPFKVIPYYYTTGGMTGFDITDDKGVLYQFTASEFCSSAGNDITGFNLTRIISADKTDTISFIYTTYSQRRISINQQAVIIDKWNVRNSNIDPLPLSPAYSENTSTEEYTTSRISRIDFKQGKVVFNLVSGTDLVDNIQILGLDNIVVRTVKLNRSAGYSPTPLLYATNKLDGVAFKDKTGAIIENYGFEYNPLVSSSSMINVRHCDWWGYYNNSGVNDFVPRYTNLEYAGSVSGGTINVGNPAANREPNLNAMLSGVLKKIVYPTGGYSEFIYENNKCTLFGSTQSVVNGPGLRIYQIKSYTSAGANPLVKTYRYGINESGYGNIELLPDVSNMASETKYIYIDLPAFTPGPGKSFRQRIFYSGFLGELSALANRPVVYTEVAEYNGSETSNTGKTVYKYDYNPWSAAAMPGLTQLSIFKKHVYSLNYWDNPSLLSKTEYRKISSGYQVARETLNTYNKVVNENIKGLHVQRIYSIPQAGRESATPPYPPSYYAEQYVLHSGLGVLSNEIPAQVYTFSSYQIPAGYKNLTSTTETHYNEFGASSSKVASFQYNSNQLISEITNNSSEGWSIVSESKYPFDYAGNNLLSQMVSLNMLDYPVEKIATKNSLPTTSVKTNYFNWGSTTPRIAPQTTELKIGTNAYETRLRYTAYDTEGNPLTVSKENDQLISYIWGYGNNYPIAEVNNTAVRNIFHTSFEEGDGNSTDNDSRTGRLSKTNGYLKSIAGIDNGMYILTYWQKSGSGWVLQTNQVSVTTGTYTITVAGQVDEIRFYPATSRMSTYTYDPLVGITSKCDASDKMNFYEYDGSGRLILIRDENRLILKKICYNYAGQSTDCSVNVTASWVATGNIRCITTGGNNTGYQEREERDTNPYSSTYNQTQWLSNGYNITACPLPAPTCSFASASGFSIPTSGISSSGTTISFYLVFYSTSITLQPGSSYFIATINGGCRPSATRTINYSAGGRNWVITIYTSGQMYWYLVPGSTALSPYSSIGTSTLNYNQ
ncbi:MAG: hypothetical protein V4717_01750 [Bacteroidota bacterium]